MGQIENASSHVNSQHHGTILVPLQVTLLLQRCCCRNAALHRLWVCLRQTITSNVQQVPWAQEVDALDGLPKASQQMRRGRARHDWCWSYWHTQLQWPKLPSVACTLLAQRWSGARASRPRSARTPNDAAKQPCTPAWAQSPQRHCTKR